MPVPTAENGTLKTPVICGHISNLRAFRAGIDFNIELLEMS